ncbi:MAG: hypothetical protein IJJ28_01250, partial [Lentisphaeria bacterium]|nr:hypothetical protein [Lentisphaeria bacterium]
FGIVYREKKSGKYYGKRSAVGGFILEKEYNFFPAGCALELFTPRPDAIYELQETNSKGKTASSELNLMELPLRSAKARGVLITAKQVAKITHSRYLTPEELESYRTPEPDNGDEADSDDNNTPPEAEPPAPAEEPKPAEKPAVIEEEPQPVEEPVPVVEETEPESEPAAPVEEPPASVEEPPAPIEETEPEPEEPPAPVEETEPEEPPATVEEPPAPAPAGDELLSVQPDPPDADAHKHRGRPKKIDRGEPPRPALSGGEDPDDELGIVQPEFGF